MSITLTPIKLNSPSNIIKLQPVKPSLSSKVVSVVKALNDPFSKAKSEGKRIYASPVSITPVASGSVITKTGSLLKKVIKTPQIKPSTVLKTYTLGVPAVGIASQIPAVREYLTKKIKNILNPVAYYQSSQSIGKSLNESLSTKKPRTTISQGIKTAGLIGGSAVAATAATLGIEKLISVLKKSKTKATTLLPPVTVPSFNEKVLTSSANTSSTPISAPAFEDGVPDAPAALQIPTAEPVAEQKPEKPMKVSQNVKINIVNKQSQNKRYKNTLLLVPVR